MADNLELELLLEIEIQKSKQKAASKLREKYVKAGDQAESLSEPADLTEIDPFALSEGGLDVGTEASKTGLARSVAQGVTLGYGDEIEALFTGKTLDQIREEQAEYKEQKPMDAALGELTGALVSPGGFIKSPKAVQALGPAKEAMVRGGGAGFVYGTGTAEGDIIDRTAEGLSTGLVGGLTSGALVKVPQTIGNKFKTSFDRAQKAPTVEHLNDLKNVAYSEVEDVFAMGAGEIDTALARSSKVAADNFWVPDPTTSTSIDKFINLMTGRKAESLTLMQWDKLRQRLFKIADSDKSWGDVTRKMIYEVDAVVDEGLAAGATPALRAARSAHKLYAKAKAVEDVFEAIPMDTKDVAGAYRKAANKLLNNKSAIKFFDEEEVELIEKFSKGDFGSRAVRAIGKLQPNYTGFFAMMNLGAVTFSPWFLLYNIATGGSKIASDSTTKAQARKLLNKIGGRGPIETAMKAENPMDIVVGGYTADNVLDELFGREEDE